MEGCGASDGLERTLTLSFRPHRVAVGSLRLLPEESWTRILKHVNSEILSVVESEPRGVPHLGRAGSHRAVSTKGLTAYIASESILLISDASLSLKTSGRAAPLGALRPILDVAVPMWEELQPEAYMRFVAFSECGHLLRPDSHSWDEEVCCLDRFFHGEAVALSEEAHCPQNLYVANYARPGEVVDAFATQITLTQLDPEESMSDFQLKGSGARSPLKAAWQQLHGKERRSVAASALVDEHFFEPAGCCATGVFGRFFTTVRASPGPGAPRVSLDSSMPMPADVRQQFVAAAAERVCRAGRLTLLEFGLCAALFNRENAPEISGFELRSACQIRRPSFACALYDFVRRRGVLQPVHASSQCAPAAPERLAPSSDALHLRRVAAASRVGDLAQPAVTSTAVAAEAGGPRRCGAGPGPTDASVQIAAPHDGEELPPVEVEDHGAPSATAGPSRSGRAVVPEAGR